MPLQQYLQANFASVQNSTLYLIEEDTDDPIYNCFVFAVGETSRLILPYTWDNLDEAFAQYGYFAVNPNSALEDGGVEVYAKPTDLNRPVHTHKLTSAASETCQSKIGRDSIITHDRDLLQCPKPNSSQYTYGTVVARYRYNAAELQRSQEAVVTTSSGRVIKRKDATTTTSGRPVKKQDATTTKSGRVHKKKKTGKSS